MAHLGQSLVMYTGVKIKKRGEKHFVLQFQISNL